MTRQTIVMLDLDDVLNPSLMTKAHKSRITGYHKQQFGPVKAWVSPEHAARLVLPHVQVVWATSWVHHPELLSQYEVAAGFPAGLPRISHVTDDRTASGKLEGVRDWLYKFASPSSPLLWIDNDLAGDDLSFIEARPGPSLAVVPTEHTGLNSILYDQVDEFLSSTSTT